jgi:murein DD-endopeptidase MepM/ murein hydrolase activator NlpD
LVTIALEVQQMQNENQKKRFAGRGYYIALIACIAAVGISGYVFVKTAQKSAQETVETVAAVTVSPSPTVYPSAEPSAEADQMEDSYEEIAADTSEADTVQWPVQGTITARFSQDTLTYSQTMADWRTHEGLDIAADTGTDVTCTQSGTVTAVYQDDLLGNVVVVSHNGNLATCYANLSETAVSEGDTVSAGDLLGQVGTSALLEVAEPSHLHFEVFSQGLAVDPLDYLPEA